MSYKPFKTREDLPDGCRFATLEDEIIIEKFIAEKIRKQYPSNILLESMKELLIRAGRECFSSGNAQIWFMITNYFKEKELVDVYRIGLYDHVLINEQLLLQLHSGAFNAEFSLRSEIHSFYRRYAKNFIETWEKEALDSIECDTTFKYLRKFEEEVIEECISVAKEDLKQMQDQPIVKYIKGLFDLEEDSLEFRLVANAGYYRPSTYIEKDGYKLGVYEANSKNTKIQRAIVSVVFENVVSKKRGYRVPLISGYTHDFRYVPEEV